ncbi:alpha/beta hydrolase family protein [Thalassotalea mangrovi]|uniref:S9 family peptidase n=1 Tax=Thalassotalea mangrovi TaxID=2572245 RepID=A0A4U1BAB9_9GAMM|nr:prolyl oligopeptidase family serine peptidase [Thalassotalea mangrovi]TKB47476.1 S9 family peptidase [Thalassotalea mangrovi]
MKSFWLAFGMALLLFPTMVEPSPLTYEDFAQLPEKSMVVISPSATKAAYRHNDGQQDMVVILNIVKGEVVGTVDITELNPSQIMFVDEERLILIASENTRIRGFRGRYNMSLAFSLNLQNGDIHQLLKPGFGIIRGNTNLGNIVGISPDRQHVYMPAWESSTRYSLYKVSLTKSIKPKRVKRGTKDIYDYFVNEKGELIARERFDNQRNLHLLESKQNDGWKTIYREQTEIPTIGFTGLTPDQQHIMMNKHDEASERRAYFKISLDDGAVSEPLFSNESKDVERVLTDINRIAYGVQYSGFQPSYEFFDEHLNRRFRGIAKVLPNTSVYISDHTPDWSTIILQTSGENNSGQYLRYQRGKLGLLATERPKISSDLVNPIREFEFKARDGLTIPTLLTYPRGMEPQKLAAIMLPHGGPESYDRIGFDWMAQYFASQGYLVIQPQFRGSTGFGLQHRLKGRGEWGGKMNEDLSDAITELSKQKILDPDRVCIVGASYGGYAAIAAVTFTPDVYKCAVAINGVFDLERMLNKEKRKYGDEHWISAYWDRVITNGKLEDDFLYNKSPINFVDKVTAPILLLHGEHDTVVPRNQSESLYDTLDDAGKRVSFFELEEGDHYLTKLKNRTIALEKIDQFIKQNLQ